MTRAYKDTGGGKRTARKAAPLSLKIFRAFAVFTIIILVVLWLFQTVFFGAVYKTVKRRDMKKCTEDISEAVVNGDDSAIREAVVSASKKYNCCVSVYSVSGPAGERIAYSHIQTNCMIHNLGSDPLLTELYTNAKEDGFYEKRVEVDFDGSEDIVVPDRSDGSNPSSVIFAKVVEEDGTDYLVLADSEIVPVSATTRVLMYQLIAITAVLAIASAVISAVISKRLSRPIVKMTDEASLLAKGRYDVDFESGAGGFLEAERLGETLNYAAGELSKLDSMQKELIANISHDLRTPLTMIRGYSEVMRDIPGEMNAENIQVVIDEATRLSSLVSDVLDLSKLTEDGAAIKPERFSLTEAVRETISRYTHLTERDGYRFIFNADCDAVVYADRTRILQVIYNLINNAINYTGEDKTVTVTQTVKGGKVRICVTDTGAGIPEEELPLIWDRFYKVGGFHNRGKVGSGLGLSIVKNVLLKHNAEFGVTSTVGSGSTFWFELETE